MATKILTTESGRRVEVDESFTGEVVDIDESTPIMTGGRGKVKSIHEQFIDKTIALTNAGKHDAVKRILKSSASTEKKLAECDAALKESVSPTRKHNGVSDNAPASRGSDVVAQKEATVKHLVAQGFKESEARAIMGIDVDERKLKQLIEAGVSTEVAFNSLVEAMRR